MLRYALTKTMLSEKVYDKAVDFIKNVGFPIGVAIYLLWKGDTVINNLSEAVKDLSITMTKMNANQEAIAQQLDRIERRTR